MVNEPEAIKLPLVWIDPESEPILFVNQMVVQRQQDECVLTFGQQTPPFVLGTPDEQREQLKGIGYVPVRPAVRLGTTVSRLREFVRVIQEFLDRQEEGDGA